MKSLPFHPRPILWTTGLVAAGLICAYGGDAGRLAVLALANIVAALLVAGTVRGLAD